MKICNVKRVVSEMLERCLVIGRRKQWHAILPVVLVLIVWGQGNAPLVTSLQSSCYMTE